MLANNEGVERGHTPSEREGIFAAASTLRFGAFRLHVQGRQRP